MIERWRNVKNAETEGCHIYGNPMNSNINNLRWASHSENMKDSIKHGTHFVPDNSGAKNGQAKMTTMNVEKIKSLIASATPCKQIAKIFKVHATTIYYIASDKTWKGIK